MDAFSSDMVQWAREQFAHALENREAAAAKWTANQASQKAKQVAKATPKSWEEIKAHEAFIPATAAPSMIATISDADDSVMASAARPAVTGNSGNATVANPLKNKKVNFSMLPPPPLPQMLPEAPRSSKAPKPERKLPKGAGDQMVAAARSESI
jgi:hypothetical protein